MAIKEKLEKMDGLMWEQTGDWVWIYGDTLQHKDTLKNLGCRWSKKRQKWYWKPASENNVVEMPKSEFSVTTKDGYMGAIAWDGSNSRKGLYGADLTRAIRADFKKCGIKGVTISKESYSGGQSVYIKITPTAADFIPFEEYRNTKLERPCWHNFINGVRDPLTNKWYRTDDIQFMPAGEEKDRLFELSILDTYEYYTKGCDLNEYHFYGDDSDVYYGRSYADIFTPAFLDKLRLMKKIVDSYNYDDSNSMVDYFNRGFYEHYRLNPLKG